MRPSLLGLVVVFLILSFATHLQQYYATYGLVYSEVKSTRLSLAEGLRKLPLGYFGKRDLADLTETIMGDVNRMEHVWSHVLGYAGTAAEVFPEVSVRRPAAHLRYHGSVKWGGCEDSIQYAGAL